MTAHKFNPGDLVRVAGSYNFTDATGTKYTHVYTDITPNHLLGKGSVTPPRPRFMTKLGTPGMLLEIVDPGEKNRQDFRWARVAFPEGVGYVSLALLTLV